MLYKKNNKDVFQHEHIIFGSDYIIKKLYKSEHFYIDGTFIYPSDFKQMIVILYFDNEKRKRFPGLFALMNNKKEEGYFYLFTRINNILTIESSKELSLKSYSVDFEIGLINSLKRVFPKVKIIGCFFHYTRALRSKANEFKLLKEDTKNITNQLLNLLYTAPFLFRKDKNYINSICEKYSQNYKFLDMFINYFKSQWIKYFINGMLDYRLIRNLKEAIVISKIIIGE